MGVFTSTPEEREKKRKEPASAFTTGLLIGMQKGNARKAAREKREEERKKRIDENTL